MDLKYLDTLSNVTSLFLTAFVCSFYEQSTEPNHEADSDSATIDANGANNLEGDGQQSEHHVHRHEYPHDPIQAGHDHDGSCSHIANREGQPFPPPDVGLFPYEDGGSDQSGCSTYLMDDMDLAEYSEDKH